jgi:oligopeptidase B
VEADELPFEPPALPGRPVAPRRPPVHRTDELRRGDDYAWLRDSSDPQVGDYLRAERDFYRSQTAQLDPLRSRLESEMVTRTPAVDTSVGWRRSGVVYFTRTRQGEEYDRLYRLDPAGDGERLVLDPNELANGSHHLELGLVEPSPDARALAYSVDLTGAEIYTLRFRDVLAGRDLPDVVPGVSRGGGAWSADGAWFFYTVPDRGNRPYQVRRHLLGTGAEGDPLVVAEPDDRFELEVRSSRDGRWVVITSSCGDTSEVRLLAADDPGQPARLVAERRPGVEYTVEPLAGGWDGAGSDLLLIVTDDSAPEFRLMQAPVPTADSHGDAHEWRPVPGLPGGVGERLVSAAAMARHVVLSVRRDCEPFLRVLDRPAAGSRLPGRPSTREVHPGVPHGQLRLWHPEDPRTSHVVIVEENLVTAPAWIEIDLDSGARTVIKRTELPGADPTRYVTDRLYATAPDGVRVPVTIARRRDARRGRTAGCVLTGNGAHESCSWPRFEVGTLSLLDRDLVYAVAHVRGGGELGRRWWQAGRRRGKPRTFVDYVAVRDALVAAGWAGEVRGGARVVTRGRAAGGLLQGAVYSRAPRMWRAVVAETPLVDVVTTRSDPTARLTVEDADEWGDPGHSLDERTAMVSWSPYDNPPPPGRPALLVTGATFDRRVPVHEPARWVARLRASDDARAPSSVLLRVDLGEGAQTGPTGRYGHLRYEAEILGWVLAQLDLG